MKILNCIYLRETRMKKSIIALAVSGAALASVSASAAEVNADIYGNIQYSYAEGGNGSEFTDNGSTFGIKGDTKINEDLTAFFKYELEADADEKNSDVSVGVDQAYVGLKGGFGKVQLGTFDSIYNNAIQDDVDQFEFLGFESASTTEEGDTIAYFSPSLNGFEIQLSAQSKGDADETADGSYGTAVTSVIKYTLNDLTVAVGYDSNDNTADENQTTGLSVAYALQPNLNVTLKYETESETQDIYGLSTRYGYGYGDLYASYQTVDPDAAASEDYDEYGVGITYDLASNIYVYGEFGQFGSDEDSQSAVGVYYGF